MTYVDMMALLDEEGYSPGYPPWTRSLSEMKDDVERIATGAECESCDHVGMSAHPWHRADTRSWRIIAICENCGEMREW